MAVNWPYASSGRSTTAAGGRRRRQHRVPPRGHRSRHGHGFDIGIDWGADGLTGALSDGEGDDGTGHHPVGFWRRPLRHVRYRRGHRGWRTAGHPNGRPGPHARTGHGRPARGSARRLSVRRIRGPPGDAITGAPDTEPDGNHDGCETSPIAASHAVTATEWVALTSSFNRGFGVRSPGVPQVLTSSYAPRRDR
jgi:hypothetical protein